jgi:hypothetical protein
MTTTRGIRNKNPLNIRKNDEKFKGEIRPSQDDQFKEFLDFGYGYRAAFVILQTYISKHNLDTIPKIINRWAPSHENPTQQYIDTISQWSGIGKNEKIDFANGDKMTKLVAAMSRFETGEPADMSQVYEGWVMFKEDRQIKEAVAVGTGGLIVIGAIIYLVLTSNKRKLNV